MSQNQPSEPRGRCPICKAPTETSYRPFCSRRCADVDLSRWLRGVYAVPGESAEPNQGTSAEDHLEDAPNGAGQHDKHDL